MLAGPCPHQDSSVQAFGGMLGWGQRVNSLPSPGLIGLLYLFMPGDGSRKSVPHPLLEEPLLLILWPPAVPLWGLATQPCIPELLSWQETSPCCPPATVSTPQPAWATILTSPMENAQSPSSHTSSDPMVLPTKRQLQSYYCIGKCPWFVLECSAAQSVLPPKARDF